MRPLDVATLTIAFVNFILAGSIYSHARRDAPSVFFTAVTFFASAWAVTVTLISLPTPPFSASEFRFIASIHYAAGYLAYLSFLWFAFYYPPRMIRSLAFPTVVTVVQFIIIIFIATSSFSLKQATPFGPLEERLIFNQPGYAIAVFYGVFVFIAEEFILAKKYKLTSGAARRYHVPLVAGVGLAGVFGLVLNNIIPWLSGNFSFFALSPIFTVTALFATSTYLILKYRFFNIKVVATELLTFSIWGFLFVRVFLAGSLRARIVDGTLLAFVILFGIFLIRSILQEIKQKERLQRLSGELEYLRDNLEIKVREQTEEIKVAYQAEKRAREELQQLDGAKDQFLLATQHHLRTPLTIMKGSLDQVSQNKKLPLELTGLFVRINEAVEKMALLTNNLLYGSEKELRGK